MKLRSGIACVRRTLIPSMALLLSVAAAAEEAMRFDIAEQPLVQALKAFAEQADMQLLYKSEAVEGATANAVIGKFARRGALEQLLSGTGLEVIFMSDGAATIRAKSSDGAAGRTSSNFRPAAHGAANTFHVAQADTAQPANPHSQSAEVRDSDLPELKGIPSILVTAARTLNMDIERTADDLQPYVVFDRKEIEDSGAVSLDQFFQQRLTMSSGPTNRRDGTTTTISLRGLGAGQTLVLIDGRRVTGPSQYGTPGQADISGIPLAAIERIEILPATASGIYGGGATGGAINIILRRDYSGAEVNLTYENTFDSDTPSGKVDVSFGHHFNEGRTSLLFGGHFADGSTLYVRDRSLVQDARATILRNNPNYFLTRPPLSSRPNIVSRDGSNLVLDDGTALGAAFTSVPQGYAGVGSDGGAALAARAGQYDWALSDTSSSDSRGSGGRQALNAPEEVKFGMMSVRHEFSDDLQGFFDVSLSRRLRTFWSENNGANFVIPADSPNNPFQQDISVTLPMNGLDGGNTVEIEGTRSAVGLIKRLSSNWQVGADLSWSSASIAYGSSPRRGSAFGTAVANGTLDVLRDTKAFPVDASPYLVASDIWTPFESTMKDFNIRVAGPLWMLPAGAVTLSGAVGYRAEDLDDAWIHYRSSNISYYYPDRSQDVKSAYVELLMPLFSPHNARPGLRELELQLAVRADNYASNAGEQLTVTYVPGVQPPAGATRSRSEFTSVDPTIALKWSPLEDVAARISYGTGFLPPALNQLVSSSSIGSVGPWYTDPLRGGTPAGDNPSGPYTHVTGGNPSLQPEESESWSAGIILTPRVLPGVRLSVDYTRIRKTDTISQHPGGIQGLINDEAQFPGRIVRGANLPGDPAGWAGPILLVNNTVMNLSESWLEAWDTRLDIVRDTDRHGTFELMLLGTWQPHYVTRTLAWLPEVENAGRGSESSTPLKFRGGANVSWSKDAWRVGWNTSYYNSYRLATWAAAESVAAQGGGGRVSSQIYHDVFVSYDFGLPGSAVPALLEQTQLQFGVRNVFNEAPPLDMDSRWNGLFSPFGDPRMATYYLSIKKAF